MAIHEDDYFVAVDGDVADVRCVFFEVATCGDFGSHFVHEDGRFVSICGEICAPIRVSSISYTGWGCALAQYPSNSSAIQTRAFFCSHRFNVSVFDLMTDEGISGLNENQNLRRPFCVWKWRHEMLLIFIERR